MDERNIRMTFDKGAERRQFQPAIIVKREALISHGAEQLGKLS